MTTLLFYTDLMIISDYVNKSTCSFYWKFVKNISDEAHCHYVLNLMGYSR